MLLLMVSNCSDGGLERRDAHDKSRCMEGGISARYSSGTESGSENCKGHSKHGVARCVCERGGSSDGSDGRVRHIECGGGAASLDAPREIETRVKK